MVRNSAARKRAHTITRGSGAREGAMSPRGMTATPTDPGRKEGNAAQEHMRILPADSGRKKNRALPARLT